MRKSVLALSSLIVSGLLAATAITNAVSLYTKGANKVSFNVGQTPVTTSYYLIGSFNDWTSDDDNYLFIDVTSSMTPETNKIAEYELNGVALNKDASIKIKDSEGTWYGASDKYSHCWSNEVSTDSNDNYLAPMSSNSYTFYLKFYNNSTYSIYVSARKDRLHFETGGAEWPDWLKDGTVPRITIKNSNSGNAKDNPGSIIITGTKNADNNYDFVLTDEQYDSILSGSGTSYFAYQRYSTANSVVWNYSAWMQLSNSDTNNAFWLNWRGDSYPWDGWDASSGNWWTV